MDTSRNKVRLPKATCWTATARPRSGGAVVLYSAASVFICTANALAGGGTGLGTLASESTLRELFVRAGVAGLRRVVETPFNRVFEARR